jgi:hypothetical protein
VLNIAYDFLNPIVVPILIDFCEAEIGAILTTVYQKKIRVRIEENPSQ